MKIGQRFTVARPLAEVWAFFQDVPAVARCMPGAELTDDKGDGLYGGKVKVRLGPFGANFEGEAKVSADAATHSGHVEGKGVDRRGGSRTRMVMDYRLVPADGGTEVTVDADVTLAGVIAQFGRTSLIQETANILVQDFVAALERELTSAATTDAAASGVTSAAKPPMPETPAAAPAIPPIAAEAQTRQPARTARPHVPAAAETAAGRQMPELPHVPEAADTAKPQGAPGPAAAADRRQGAERHVAEAAAPEPAATAERRQAETAERQEPVATSPKAAPHEIRGGSLALRALWAWLKSLLRRLLGSDKARH